MRWCKRGVLGGQVMAMEVDSEGGTSNAAAAPALNLEDATVDCLPQCLEVRTRPMQRMWIRG